MKNFSLLLICTAITFSTAFAQQETGTVTDIDGNVYKTVIIGDQEWMAENLKVTRYRNGDTIPTGHSNSIWAGLSTGAYSVYDNDEGKLSTYGYLYNWYAVNESRKLAPEDWHVPTDADWKELEIYLDMSQSEADKSNGRRGKYEGGKLKEAGTSHWNSSNTGATDESGFTALPGGFRFRNGQYRNIGYHAYFWSSSEFNSTNAWDRVLTYGNSGVGRGNYNKISGFSVRLVKDK